MYTEYNPQSPSVYTVPETKSGTSECRADDQPYSNIESDRSGKPRPPARVPLVDDEYNYITPMHYAEPYSDVVQRDGANHEGGNVEEDDEHYIEIRPS